LSGTEANQLWERIALSFDGARETTHGKQGLQPGFDRSRRTPKRLAFLCVGV